MAARRPALGGSEVESLTFGRFDENFQSEMTIAAVGLIVVICMVRMIVMHGEVCGRVCFICCWRV